MPLIFSSLLPSDRWVPQLLSLPSKAHWSDSSPTSSTGSVTQLLYSHDVHRPDLSLRRLPGGAPTILPGRCRRARRGPRPPLRRAAIGASPELRPRVDVLPSATSPPIGAHGELPRVLRFLPGRRRRARRGPRPPLRRAAIRASPELWPRVNLLLSATSPPIGAHGELPRVFRFLPGLVPLSFRRSCHRNATGRPAAPAPQLQPPHVRACTELPCAPALRSRPGCGQALPPRRQEPRLRHRACGAELGNGAGGRRRV